MVPKYITAYQITKKIEFLLALSKNYILQGKIQQCIKTNKFIINLRNKDRHLLLLYQLEYYDSTVTYDKDVKKEDKNGDVNFYINEIIIGDVLNLVRNEICKKCMCYQIDGVTNKKKFYKKVLKDVCITHEKEFKEKLKMYNKISKLNIIKN